MPHSNINVRRIGEGREIIDNKGLLSYSEFSFKSEIPGGTLNTGRRAGRILHTESCRKSSPAGSVISNQPNQVRGRDKCKEYCSREEEDQLQLTPQECEDGSNPRTWDMRRPRINLYTGIVELASSPGHTSSDSTQIKDQLQLNPQGEEDAPSTRTWDTRRSRIKLYTGIVELASSAGHKSSSTSIQLNRAKHPTQEGREVRGSRSSVHTKSVRTGQVKRMLRKLNQTCKWRKGGVEENGHVQ